MAHRIDEIKERINKYREEEWSYASDDIPDWSHEVEYLLSRLEIAEKALEWYSDIPNYDRRLSGGTSAVEADAGGRAREAIQQIRS